MGWQVRRQNPSFRSSRSEIRYSPQIWRLGKIPLRGSALPVISCRLPDCDISLLQQKVAIHPHSCRGDRKRESYTCRGSRLPVFAHQSRPLGAVEEKRPDGCSTLRKSCSGLLSPNTDGRRGCPHERQVSSNSVSAPFGSRVDEKNLDIVLSCVVASGDERLLLDGFVSP